MNRALAALGIVVAGAVAAFAVYTFGWHREDSRRKPESGSLTPVPFTKEVGGQRLYRIREGDVIRLPGTATDCVATGEGGTPGLFCTHTRRTRFEVVFNTYGVAVYDLARHGEPMVPTFFVPGELKKTGTASR